MSSIVPITAILISAIYNKEVVGVKLNNLTNKYLLNL